MLHAAKKEPGNTQVAVPLPPLGDPAPASSPLKATRRSRCARAGAFSDAASPGLKATVEGTLETTSHKERERGGLCRRISTNFFPTVGAAEVRGPLRDCGQPAAVLSGFSVYKSMKA